MAEDYGLGTHFRYHKQKIILFLAAMRGYADELRRLGAEVFYFPLTPQATALTFEEKLHRFLKETNTSHLSVFEIEDKFFERRIQSLAVEAGIELETLPSPMFLVSRASFAEYVRRQKKPFMKSFYEELRRKTGILMDDDLRPVGGQFSFDTENRKRLPKGTLPPPLPPAAATEHVRAVAALCEEIFSGHPGDGAAFWLPTTREASLRWLRKFLDERFAGFGAYEDAISSRSDVLYHSALSPLLNLGLLTPGEVIDEALASAEQNRVPLSSLEGFIRQVIGWREFVRGIYQCFSEQEDELNFWGHTAPLGRCWYDATTGIPPVDDAIRKALRLGYNHHIERLMLLSNVMLLSELNPREVHRWFMEMYVDSSDWVMGPNVYGMAQFSDGGIFATKPYICGSNYILKMSDYQSGDWCDVVDGLYWSFIDKHRKFYATNARTKVIVGNLERLGSERKEKIYRAADAFREHASAL